MGTARAVHGAGPRGTRLSGQEFRAMRQIYTYEACAWGCNRFGQYGINHITGSGYRAPPPLIRYLTPLSARVSNVPCLAPSHSTEVVFGKLLDHHAQSRAPRRPSWRYWACTGAAGVSRGTQGSTERSCTNWVGRQHFRRPSGSQGSTAILPNPRTSVCDERYGASRGQPSDNRQVQPWATEGATASGEALRRFAGGATGHRQRCGG